MKTFKKFILFYLLGATIYFIIALIFQSYVPINTKSFGALIFLFVMLVIGYFLSFRTNSYNKNDKTKIPEEGYIICLSLFVFATLCFKLMDWYHEKYQANFEQNQSALKNLPGQDEETIEIAFKKLESTFSNSNDFRLRSFYVNSKDTLIGKVYKTFSIVTFNYFVGRDFDQLHLSRVLVFNNKAQIFSLNEKIYEKGKFTDPNSSVYYNKKAIDSFQKQIDNLPDSIKNIFQIDTTEFR